MSYPVVDFIKYAKSFDQFRNEYPYLVIETYCKAFSGSTFGDQCKGQFGSLEFETINFNRTQYLNKYIVESHKSGFGYDVGAEIGIGFKRDGTTLIIRPFVNGWIYSAGAYNRCLDIGLSVTKVTFIPKSQQSTEIISVSLFDFLMHNIGTNKQFEYSHEP